MDRVNWAIYTNLRGNRAMRDRTGQSYTQAN